MNKEKKIRDEKITNAYQNIVRSCKELVQEVGSELSDIINDNEKPDGETIDEIVEYLRSLGIYKEKTKTNQLDLLDVIVEVEKEKLPPEISFEL